VSAAERARAVLATYDAHDPATTSTSGFHKDGEPVEPYSLVDTAAEMAAVLRELLSPGVPADTRTADPAAGAKVGDPDPEPDWEGEFCAEGGVGYDTCTLHIGHEGDHLQAQWVQVRARYEVAAVWS
jgi:hypothetical protein